jgi:N-acetylglucosamine kinase-like BadF-type ATPase
MFAHRALPFFASKWMSKYDSSDHAQLYISVDGGGTSCRGRIEDAEGRLLRQGDAGPDPITLVAWAEQATATEYASLAPVTLSFAEAGDPFAEEIAAEGALPVSILIRSLVELGAPHISLLGGLASRLVQWLSPDVLHFLSPPEGDAVAGALFLVRRDGRALTEPRRQRKVRRHAD